MSPKTYQNLKDFLRHMRVFFLKDMTKMMKDGFERHIQVLQTEIFDFKIFKKGGKRRKELET